MPNVEEGEKGGPEDEAREDLFEEPITQRALQTYTPIDTHLRTIGRLRVPIPVNRLNRTLALMAHRRHWYNLTVPALIPLVEGIARDYLQEEHGITERRGLTAVRDALDRNIPESVFREELQ